MPELTRATREAARRLRFSNTPSTRPNVRAASPVDPTASGTSTRPAAAWWRPPILAPGSAALAAIVPLCRVQHRTPHRLRLGLECRGQRPERTARVVELV